MLRRPFTYPEQVITPVIGNNGRVTGTYSHEGSAMRKARDETESSLAFQLELANRIRALTNPDEIAAAACKLLGHKLDASRVLYAEIDDELDTFFIRHNWTAPGFASLAGETRSMKNFGPEMIAHFRAGNAMANNDVRLDPRTAGHAAAFQQIGVAAELVVPLVRDGKLQIALAVHSATARAWSGEALLLAQDTAERTWFAVETVQAQEALRAQRDQSQYIFDSMKEGFAVLDRHWTILRMNAEGLRITQRCAAEVIGQNHWLVFPEVVGSEAEAVYRRVMRTGTTEIIELPHVWPDKTCTWIETRAHGLPDGGIAFFFRDITDRRSAQEQLTLADRRKDEFLAMLAHELRNPLAPIGAAAQLLQRVKLDDARVRQTSQIIGRQVDHMTHLINDLLDVSRVTRGLVTLDKTPQDIRHIIAEAVEQVTPLIQARHHHLALHLAPDTTLVDGDKMRLVQIMTNILNNAAKYTHEGGNIFLKTTVHASQVHVEVSDDGIGMPTDLVAHAFDLFAQAERSSDRSAGGLGLGLALVKSLAELHGGSVTCQSDGIGKGSKFTVCLPCSTAMDNAKAASLADDAAEHASRPLRILIVDDNVDAASMLAMLLEASGHEVWVEHAARAALGRTTQKQPDVYLLDIGLPEMDGTELARRLRQQPQSAAALLIAVTGYGQDSDRERTHAAGFDHHLVKPLDIKKLQALLQQVDIASC